MAITPHLTMFKYFIISCLLVTAASSAIAQVKPDTIPAAAKKAGSKDTLKATRQDTLQERKLPVKKDPVFHPDSTHSPHKAVIHSLILPGWGQVYNHQWYFVPVIYGGLGLLVDAIIYNNTYYKEFLQLARYREYGITPTPGMAYYADAILYQNQPDQAIYDANDGYRRNRDLCILGFVAGWGIQCVQAYIQAKFIHSYSVDNNLSMRVEPGVLNQAQAFTQTSALSYVPGLKITFTFGKPAKKRF